MKYTCLILAVVLSFFLIFAETHAHADLLRGDYNYAGDGPGGQNGNVLGAIDGFGGSVDQDNMIVPEPTTMLLLGTGMIGLAAFGRRIFKKR